MASQSTRPNSSARHARRRRSDKVARSVQLRCEQLEGRITPALFNVHSPYSISGLNNNGCVVAADFNKDGFADAVLTNFGTDYGNGAARTITILRNNQDGTFAHVNANTGGTNVAFAAVADINGDSWPDLVVSDENGQNTGSV